MIKILICLEDNVLTDIVKTAFKQFPSMTPFPVAKKDVLSVLAERDFHAVVLDLEPSTRGRSDDTLAAIRENHKKIELLAVIQRQDKDRFNRMKVELGIFSYLALPIDPFELMRRIVRLEKHLIDKHPLGLGV